MVAVKSTERRPGLRAPPWVTFLIDLTGAAITPLRFLKVLRRRRRVFFNQRGVGPGTVQVAEISLILAGAPATPAALFGGLEKFLDKGQGA